MEDKTIRERISILELKMEQMEKVASDYKEIESYELTVMTNIEKLTAAVQKNTEHIETIMKITNEYMKVREYGSWTYKIIKFLGVAILGIAAFGHKLVELYHNFFPSSGTPH